MCADAVGAAAASAPSAAATEASPSPQGPRKDARLGECSGRTPEASATAGRVAEGGDGFVASLRAPHAWLDTIGQISTLPVSNSYGFEPPKGLRNTSVFPVASAASIAFALVIGWKFEE